MNKKEAEDLIYKSYLKAEKYQNYNAKDALKRRPELTRDLIRNLKKAPTVLVTGSKGKGSVASMISCILQSEYKVGLMTSPHISDFCERFKIDSVNISDEDFIKYMSCLKAEIESVDKSIPMDICISPMGIQTALALTYFNAMNTDINILECGKGARFDDVNNAYHEYAVINTIFLEHTRELGESIEEIAFDKSHIITGEEKAVFVAEQQGSVLKVITERAQSLKVPLWIYGRDFEALNIRYTNEGMLFDVIIKDKTFKDILIPLLGEHQAKNCALAMALSMGILDFPDMVKVKEKLKNLNWPGRMQILSRDPFILLDACINSESSKNVLKVLEKLRIDKVTCIVGIPMDKDYVGVVKNMTSVSKNIILTKSQNPHYVFSKDQTEKLLENGISSVWTDSIEEAVNEARQFDEAVVILGTTSLISDTLDYWTQP